MIRYKTETRSGLVALYDIRPGNGAGQFLQPRSPHGARLNGVDVTVTYIGTSMFWFGSAIRKVRHREIEANGWVKLLLPIAKPNPKSLF